MTDAIGNVYVIGLVSGQIQLGSTIQNSAASGIYVAKMSPSRTWLWAVKAGGSSNEYAYGLALDGNGRLYVVEHFWSPIMNLGKFTLTNRNFTADIFVA